MKRGKPLWKNPRFCISDYLFMKHLNNVFNLKEHIYNENIDILQYLRLHIIY